MTADNYMHLTPMGIEPLALNDNDVHDFGGLKWKCGVNCDIE